MKLFSTGADSPRKLRRSERKPLVTGINELKRRAKEERKTRKEVREITLRPPENGILVKSLVPVARDVFAARSELFDCASAVVGFIPVHTCR